MSFSPRINKLKEMLAQLDLDGIYVTNLTNVRYLSGFTGSAGSLLILNNKQYFFTDGRYIEQSKRQIKDYEIHIVGSAHYKAIADKTLIMANAKIGLEADFVSLNMFDQIVKLLPNVAWEKVKFLA